MWRATVDIMVDLETLSTEPNAVILSIGACEFDPDTGTIFETFYSKLNHAAVTNEQGFAKPESGLHVSQSTLDWWTKQSKEAYEAAFNIYDAPPRYADPLEAFKQFVIACRAHSPGQKLRIWGNDPDFDIVILNQNFKAMGGILPPWQFWESRSVRTMKDLWQYALKKGDPKNIVKRMGTHHNAKDDAIHQALIVSKVWQAIQKAGDSDRAQKFSETEKPATEG